MNLLSKSRLCLSEISGNELLSKPETDPGNNFFKSFDGVAIAVQPTCYKIFSHNGGGLTVSAATLSLTQAYETLVGLKPIPSPIKELRFWHPSKVVLLTPGF